MIHVDLQNGNVLLFHDYEKVHTVGWIDEKANYWSDEKTMRADELRPGRYIIERINCDGEAIVEKDWISPIVSVCQFIPKTEFI